MAEYLPKKGDVVKVKTDTGVIRGIVISYYSPLGHSTVDILVDGPSNYRATPATQEITHIDDLNVFDRLREKSVLAEKPGVYEARECYSCAKHGNHALKPCSFVSDPFSDEIYGDDTKNWFCDPCLDESAAEI